MEGTLDIGVLFDQGVDFRFKEAIGYFMGKNDLSHVNIFIVKGVIELYTL